MSGRSRPRLSATQITAAGAGTVMATVAGSYLGVAGTLLGAGLMSVITTAGGAITQHYLDRGSRRVRDVTVRKISTVRAERRDDRGAGVRVGDERPSERTVEFRVPAEPADHTAELDTVSGTGGASGTSVARDTTGAPDRARWRLVALQAVAVFAIVIAGVVLFEVLTGKPLAGTVRGESGTGTSLTGGRTLPSMPTPAPEPPESETKTPESTPATSPPEPPTGPTAGPTTRPTAGPTSGPPRPTPRPPSRPPTSPPASRPPGIPAPPTRPPTT